MGMTFVIISGNFDISVGAICAFSGAIALQLMENGFSMASAILCAVVVCTGVGFINGFSVAKLGMPSLIATMAMMTILQGAMRIVTGGYPVYTDSEAYRAIAGITFGPGDLRIGIPIVYFAAAIIIAQFVLRKTRYGSSIYSIGGNEEASRLSGIGVDRRKISVFVINGFAAGVAGIILSSRVATATMTAGDGYELDAIAAVVIGGTSVAGGEGSAVRTVIGVLLMAIIGNILTMMGVTTFWQRVVKGLIIWLAVGFDSYNKKRLQKV
jgi:ribose transport system permease protein